MMNCGVLIKNFVKTVFRTASKRESVGHHKLFLFYWPYFVYREKNQNLHIFYLRLNNKTAEI